MAPQVKAVRNRKSGPSADDPLEPPSPFKKPPEVLAPFIADLSPKHVYITHVDLKPIDFKRKIFLVPVAMNLAIVALFALRVWWIVPWYWDLVKGSFLRQSAEELGAVFDPGDASWPEIAWEVARRGSTLMLDFVLAIFVWPWPVEFAFGREYGNPMRWRFKVGFREKEVYVRRSREWDRQLREEELPDGSHLKKTTTGDGDGAVGIARAPAKKTKKRNGKPKTIDFLDADHTDRLNGLLALVRKATAPMLQHEKTGYLTMDGEWDLDWEAMVRAHAMIDGKEIAVDAFRSVVLVHHEKHGWMCLVPNHAGAEGGASGAGSQSHEDEVDEKRRKIFEFRDALSAIGKEDLFFRWVETVQYEATRPDGFGPERQVEAAKKIRELFQKEGIDFDKFWKESVGTDAFA